LSLLGPNTLLTSLFSNILILSSSWFLYILKKKGAFVYIFHSKWLIFQSCGRVSTVQSELNLLYACEIRISCRR
jgi:hypothetical protein